jgi:hypothetical protein
MDDVASTQVISDPACPIRPGELCHLCHPGSSGPDTCGLVYLVTTDPELHAELDRKWAEYRQAAQAEPSPDPSV